MVGSQAVWQNRPRAAGRVGRQPTARVHRHVHRVLYRLHGAIFGRSEDDRSLATDPGDDRRPVFVIMAPTGLAFLATTTRQRPGGFGPPYAQGVSMAPDAFSEKRMPA